MIHFNCQFDWTVKYLADYKRTFVNASTKAFPQPIGMLESSSAGRVTLHMGSSMR